MPFGRDIWVFSSNIMLDGGSGHPKKGEISDSESELPVRNGLSLTHVDANLQQSCHYSSHNIWNA